MVTETKNLPHSRIKLTITGNVAGFKHAFEHEIEHASQGLTIPGFRPGKAPEAKVLERLGRPRIEAGALDHLITDAYFEAVAEAKINPVSDPKVDIVKYEAPGEDANDEDVVVTFTAEVDVLPEINVEGYKKVKLKKPKEPEVQPDDITKVLDYLRKQQATFKEVAAETVVAKGMWVDVSYEGQVGKVKRPDMKNEHHPFIVGEGQLVPGFEDALLGMKVGEEKTFEVTFPKDYHAKELSGKKAEFTVKVNELKEIVLPELDNEFAKHFGHDTYEKLEKAIKENIHEEKQVESRQMLEEQVLDEVLKVIDFEIPASLVEKELERRFEEAKERLQKMNFNWDAYLDQVKKTADEVREEMRPQAEKSVRVGLILGRIIETEGIKNDEHAGRLALNKLVETITAEK